MTNEEQEIQVQNFNNEDFMNAGIMQLRLDPDPTLQKFQLLLTGQQIVIKQEQDGTYSEVAQQISKPKANEEGIHTIMFFVRNVVNTQTVQGNFDEDRYNAYIVEAHSDFAELIFNNMDDFEMTTKAGNDICNAFTKIIIPYMSRTLHNKERDSYAQTNKTLETINNAKQKLGLFARN